MASRQNPRPLLPTGIPGLDEVVGGGLRAGSLYLICGCTGAGKTILAAQAAFHRASNGGRALFVTLISESHGKLLDHLGGFGFFDAGRVGREVVLLNGYEVLKSRGAAGLLELITSLVGEHRTELLVLEGFATLRGMKLGEFEIAQFVFQLNSLLTTLGCTGLLVDPAAMDASSPEQALVDGIVELGTYARNGRLARELQVHKHRAANPFLGRSMFRITDGGIVVYPRLEEAVARRPRSGRETRERALFGIEHLDAMMRGGLMRGATTLVLGAPGSGKTLLGLKYLEEGLKHGEKALYFGFYEAPDRLLGKAEGVGMDLRPGERSGALRMLWQPAVEFTFDELGHRLLAAVREQQPRRLMIDGIDAFHQCAMRRERLPLFLTALTAELRASNVDVVFTQEMALHHPQDPGYVVSALVENIVMLRYVEVRSQLHRMISILKMRESEYDTSIRELRISSSGMAVADTFASAESILAQEAQGRYGSLP
jgi:circadian clock protein KaiC